MENTQPTTPPRTTNLTHTDAPIKKVEPCHPIPITNCKVARVLKM
jgi:hypothetical protein